MSTEETEPVYLSTSDDKNRLNSAFEKAIEAAEKALQQDYDELGMNQRFLYQFVVHQGRVRFIARMNIDHFGAEENQ